MAAYTAQERTLLDIKELIRLRMQLTYVVLSTVTCEDGRITGSRINIDRMGSKNSSGGLIKASSFSF
jgi:hypothetical protein